MMIVIWHESYTIMYRKYVFDEKEKEQWRKCHGYYINMGDSPEADKFLLNQRYENYELGKTKEGWIEFDQPLLMEAIPGMAFVDRVEVVIAGEWS